MKSRRAYINYSKGYKMTQNRREELSEIIARIKVLAANEDRDLLDNLVLASLRENARNIMKQHLIVKANQSLNSSAIAALKQA